MRNLLVTMVVLAAVQVSFGQSIRSLVNGGNDLYHDKKFTDAEVNYRKALQKEKDLVQGHFDLGNALAKQGKLDEAAKEFSIAAEKAEQKDTKASAYYNIGNTHMGAQQYADAVRSYVDALKINPDDAAAKYNLSYALEKLRQQQQQQNQQKKNDKNQNKKNNQQDQDQKKNQDKQKNDQNKQKQPNNQQQNAQQQQKRMSKSDAERILEVLRNSEKDVQKKLRERPAERATTDKDW